MAFSHDSAFDFRLKMPEHTALNMNGPRARAVDAHRSIFTVRTLHHISFNMILAVVTDNNARIRTGRSAWCVIRVTQPCWISQVCRQSARDTGLVALATAHAPSDLQLTDTTWMAWVLGHAA